jgi:anthranilate phosphoribosyltransferase
VLQRLGARHALVVHGHDGLDEITLAGGTLVAELRDNRVEEYEILPGEFGLAMADLQAIRVETPEQSKAMLISALEDHPGPARDIVLLNAGAALYAAGVAGSIGEGVERARAVVSNGGARAKLDQYVAATRRLAGKIAP